MNRSTRLPLISLSILLLIGAVALNLTYRIPQTVAPSAVPANQASRSGQGPASSTQPVLSSPASLPSPQELSTAFGWAQAAPLVNKPASVTPSQPERAIDAQWIHYVGTITGSDGVTYSYFKDQRSGQIIRAATGRTVDGWTIEKSGPGQVILEHYKQKLNIRLSQ